eukprot:CAMPEP_0196657638 /NCGR_PEP_ID=MMETSP1086-20130531/24549_1 /TAXON_ID=77921 /ORGANISM="Cyanoptyche  gloeocystis , Strain SAG4.97" /LENGTH=251 /DNA_ID=CAMNT_0041990835 /DNA_START=48 /DNA_END=803 /DNA_ORIENTATION=+
MSSSVRSRKSCSSGDQGCKRKKNEELKFMRPLVPYFLPGAEEVNTELRMPSLGEKSRRQQKRLQSPDEKGSARGMHCAVDDKTSRQFNGEGQNRDSSSPGVTFSQKIQNRRNSADCQTIQHSHSLNQMTPKRIISSTSSSEERYAAFSNSPCPSSLPLPPQQWVKSYSSGSVSDSSSVTSSKGASSSDRSSSEEENLSHTRSLDELSSSTEIACTADPSRSSSSALAPLYLQFGRDLEKMTADLKGILRIS